MKEPCVNVGGVSGETNDMYEFSTATLTWRLLQTAGAVPGARAAFGMTVVLGRVIIYGGSGGTGAAWNGEWREICDLMGCALSF